MTRPQIEESTDGNGGPVRHARLSLVYGAFLGAVGGALGWLLAEPFVEWRFSARLAQLALVLFCSAVYAALIGGAIGAADGLKERSRANAGRGAMVGAVLGLLGGLLGGWLGEVVYVSFSRLGLGLVGRSLGWLAVGAFIGCSVGAAARSPRKALFCAIGGMVGGYVGGGSFELVDRIVAGERTGRLVALVITGGCIGAMITLVEELVKDAWLIVANGRLEGVRFVLTKGETTIGRLARSDVGLADYEGVAREHARIVRESSGYALVAGEDSTGVTLNGKPAARERLLNGDRIGVGRARLVFETHAMSADRAAPAPEAPFLETPSGPVPIRGSTVSIGSDRSCQVVVAGAGVKGRHAEIRDVKGRLVVFDLSGGAMTVNGRVTAENLLKDGFVVTVGDVRLVFRNPDKRVAQGDHDAVEISPRQRPAAP